MIKLARAFISDVLKTYAAPEDRQDATYAGPNYLSDEPVQVVVNPWAGGLAVSTRTFGTESYAAATTHSEIVFQVASDTDRMLRGWQIELDNASGADAVVSDWRLSIENSLQTIGVRLVSGKVANLSDGDSIVICPFLFDVNQATGAATWGMEGVTAFESFRFRAGDILRFGMTATRNLGVEINYVADDTPLGVYLGS